MRPSLLNTSNLTEQLSTRLREEIYSGQRPLGSRLPTEDALSSELGVSRTVVREAVARLRADGLINTRQGLGAFVTESFLSVPFRMPGTGTDSAVNVRNVYELRLGLEAEAAAFAAERASPTQLKEIQAALKAVNVAAREGAQGVEEDMLFHRAIARATNNPLYDAFLCFLELHIRSQLIISRDNSTRAGRIPELEIEHNALYEAIASGNPETARRASLTHLGNAIDRWGR